MVMPAALLLCLLQDVRRYEFTESFERSGVDPYEGWEQVVDDLHPKYNLASRYRWDEEHRIKLADEKGTVVVGPIVRASDDEVSVKTAGGVVDVKRRLIVTDEVIDTRRPPDGDHAVSVRCDRGAGAFRTRRNFLGTSRYPMEVGVDYTYRLSAAVRFVRHDRNRASIALRWLDMAGEPLGEDRSSPLTVADDWTELSLTVPGVDERARLVQIVLRVEGPDVSSECLFDEVRLVAQPRVRIDPADRDHFIYAARRKVEAKVRFRQGIPDGMRLEIRPLDRLGAEAGPAVILGSGAAAADSPADFAFTPRDPGYYEIHARLIDADGALVADERIPVVSIGTIGEAARGDLGVTMNPYSTPYADPQELLGALGVSNVKLVLWERGSARGGRALTLPSLGRLVEDVNLAAPDIVGVLGRAPDFLLPASASRFAYAHPWTLFAEPDEEWDRPLRLTLAQAVPLDDWQIGPDFADYPPPASGADAPFSAASRAIKRDNRAFNRVGLPVAAVDRPAGTDFGAVELADPDAVVAGSSDHLVYRLPVPAVGSDGSDVVADMIRTIVRARARGDLPARVYLPLEDLDRRGLLTADGRPRPALAAFPVLNEVLANTAVAKDLHLFNANEAIFEKLGSSYAVVVAWTDGEPKRQAIFAGDDARLVDAWGRVSVPKPDEPVLLGPLPVYLINVDKELLRTQSSVKFTPAAVALQLRDSKVDLGFTNHFGVAMKNVSITVEAEESGWTIDPQELRVIASVAPGEASPPQTIRLRPPEWARTGKTTLRIGMTYRVGDRDYRFAISREVGLTAVVEPSVAITREADGSATVEIVLRDLTQPEEGTAVASRTIQVTTKLPGRAPVRGLVTVMPGQKSKALIYPLPDAASLPEDAAVEVSLYQADGDRVIGTTEFPIKKQDAAAGGN